MKFFDIRTDKRQLKANYDYFNHMGFLYQKAFSGKLMKRGLKLKSIKILNKIKIGLKKNIKINPFFLITIFFLKFSPLIYFKPIKLGRASQGIPLQIKEFKQIVYPLKC